MSWESGFDGNTSEAESKMLPRYLENRLTFGAMILVILAVLHFVFKVI